MAGEGLVDAGTVTGFNASSDIVRALPLTVVVVEDVGAVGVDVKVGLVSENN